jgi:tRNA-splicing ligase RtcB
MKLASGDGKAREGCYGLDVESQGGKDYIKDLDFCLAFALENRRQMVSRVVDVLSKRCGDGTADWDSLINRNHNHAEHTGKALRMPKRA